MNTYRDYDETITAWSTLLPPWRSLVYCLTICKRAAPLYFEFVERQGWGDKKAVTLSHDLLWLAIAGQPPAMDTVEECISRLYWNTPDTAEFSNCSDATDAGLIHLCSTDLIRTHDPQNLRSVADFCFDIVAGLILGLLMPPGIGIVTPEIWRRVEQHPFLQDELALQGRFRNELEHLHEGDVDTAQSIISEWARTPLLR